MMHRTRPGGASRFAVLVMAMGLIVVTCMVAAAGWVLYDLRTATTRRAAQLTGNLTLGLIQDIDRLVHTMDVALLSAAQGAQSPGLDAMEPQTREAVLFGAATAVHAPGTLLITDAEGVVRYTSRRWPQPLASLADRSYFQQLRDRPGSDLVIAGPMLRPTDNRWVIVVARRIGGPDQPFRGIVAGSLQVARIQALFDNFDLGAKGSITLATDDGVIIARRPLADGDLGRVLNRPELVRRPGVPLNGSFERIARSDGVSRFYSYRRLPGLPLVVAVGVSTQELYAAWQKTWVIGAVLTTLIVLGGGLTWRLIRELARRAQMENSLRASEDRLHVLFESNVTDALYLLGPDGRIESWNGTATRIMGWTAEEAIGRDVAMLFTPDDIARGEPASLLERCRRQGLVRETCWRMRKGGTQFQAAVTMDPIYWDDGSIRGFVKVTHDTTIARAEEEQRAIIIEAAPNGMMIIDEAGIITLANSQAERIFGYDRGMLVSHPVEHVVPNAGAEHAVLRPAPTCAEGERGAPERHATGRKRDGSLVLVELMLSPVQIAAGRIVIVSVVDVTERVRLMSEQHAADDREREEAATVNANLARLSRHLGKARDAAEQASRAKSRFLAGMSHELRTPLNGILGYAHLLSLEGGLTPLQQTRVAAMLGTGQHLLEMISCVLDLSEIEAERVDLRLVEIDVQVTATACLDLVRPMADEKGLSLRIEVEPGTRTTLVSDVTRLRQILLNLLGNATKFTSQGSVVLRVCQGGDRASLRIEVVDTGPGIPDEQLGRLFQDFERAETEATRTIEGAGLGLALSSRLTAVMGGRLGYAPNPVGGSVFWLELPSVQSMTGPAAPAGADRGGSDPGAMPAPCETLAILVVDDVLMNRDIATTILRSVGHRVTCVENGPDAVAAVATTRFDVVLMDVRMPGMSGLDASRRIRNLDGAHRDVPIVALTAQAFVEQVAECHAAGMDGHLAKPFTPDTLLNAVAQSAGLRRAQPARAVAPAVPVAVAAVIPLVDAEMFQRTAALLTADAASSYIETIVAAATRLSQGLREPAALTVSGEELAGAAHKLAGSAGLFGFKRMASLSGRFEQAVLSGAPEAAALADGLATAIGETLRDDRLAGCTKVGAMG